MVILTARDSVADTVAGLEGGADDYLAKPFRFEELVARIRARLRDDSSADEATMLRHGGLSLDLRTRRADVAGRSVDLSRGSSRSRRSSSAIPGTSCPASSC